MQFEILVLFFRASYKDLNEKHQPDAVNKYILLLLRSRLVTSSLRSSTLHARNIAVHTYLSVLLWNHHFSFTV